MKMKYSPAVLIFLFLAAALPVLASAMSISVNIPEKFSEVTAGEKVYFETEVKWPENDNRKDLRIEYSIKDKNGDEVAYLKVLKAIETQASFMDSISIPESTEPGLYKIDIKISDYQNLNQDVGASFRVAKSGEDFQTFFYIIIGILVVMAFAVIIGVFLLVRRKGE